MIKQSPESPMPEPYRTYVEQRSEVIGRVLENVVDADIQLVPRAITEDERLFGDNGLVYGCVVRKIEDGYKSVLYDGTLGRYSYGEVARSPEEAGALAIDEAKKGNRLRLKDPLESDAQGQYVAASYEEAVEIFIEADRDVLVAMPHMVQIDGRYSVGRIDLGEYGTFGYIGREVTTQNDGQEVYGGCDIALAHHPLITVGSEAGRKLEIPDFVVAMGLYAINRYHGVATHIGRVSFDVLSGYTDNGQHLADVVDITPRVGGTTPAEVLAIEHLRSSNELQAYARSVLVYDPTEKPITGTNFIDTPTLLVNAGVIDGVNP